MIKEKTALVLQGGALRTIFTSGVLDAFIAKKYFPFDILIGVSAGTMCLSYYIGNQYGTTFNIIKNLAEDKDFINLKNAFKKEGIVNLSHLRNFTTSKFPIDYDTAFKQKSKSIVEFVATDVKTGKPVYLNPTLENWNDCLIASSALPIYSKGSHILNGQKLMDGSWSDPLPVKRAIELGATRVIVVRTSPISHRDSKSYIGALGSVWFKGQEALKKSLLEEHLCFNAAVDFMNKKHDGIEIIQIAPEHKLNTTASSSSEKKVIADYRNGLDLGLRFVMKEELDNNYCNNTPQDSIL